MKLSGAVVLAAAVVLALWLIGGDGAPDPASGPRASSRLSNAWERLQASYADLRWRYVPWLRITDEKRHALWNRALEFALTEDDWLGFPQESSAIDATWLGPDYAPAVDGLLITPLNSREIRVRGEALGYTDSVTVHGGRRFDTPFAVPVIVSRRVGVWMGDTATEQRSCRRTIVLSCRRSWGEWQCEREDAKHADCDLRSLLARSNPRRVLPH